MGHGDPLGALVGVSWGSGIVLGLVVPWGPRGPRFIILVNIFEFKGVRNLGIGWGLGGAHGPWGSPGSPCGSPGGLEFPMAWGSPGA